MLILDRDCSNSVKLLMFLDIQPEPSMPNFKSVWSSFSKCQIQICINNTVNKEKQHGDAFVSNGISHPSSRGEKLLPLSAFIILKAGDLPW